MIRRRIVIVGAGLSGTVTAVNLLGTPGLDVVLVERSGSFGPGLAYSTPDPLHLLNVPAGRLSARSQDPDHFLDWARRQGQRRQAQEGSYLPRSTYGRYLRELLDEADRHAEPGQLVRRQGNVTAARRTAVGERVTLADGTTLDGHAVVLALGSEPADLPGVLPDDDRVFSNPWLPAARAPAEGTTTLLVGSGLTAVDATLSICSAGGDTRVVALSRSGRLPFPHLEGGLRPPAPPPPWPRPPARIDDLVHAIRAHAAALDSDGFDWRDVVDGVRPHVPSLWRSLPPAEQRRFLNVHMRAWEVRRHRMAPQVAAQLAALEQAGRFRLRAGSLRRAAAAPDGIHVVVGSGDPERAEEHLRVDRIVCCTGPRADISTTRDPLLRQLLDEGRAAPGAHGLGLRVDRDGVVLCRDGAPSPSLLAIGALRRGELWETTAVAELRAQAEAAATLLGNQRPAG